MAYAVGRDWERLPPLEVWRLMLAAILGIDLAATKEYFVYSAGRMLRKWREAGKWPDDALRRLSEHTAKPVWLMDLPEKEDPQIPPFDQLAEDLQKDPDFYKYVLSAAKGWLRKNDELEPEFVVRSFAFEGHACTVDYAQSWYDQRERRTGRWRETWIKLLEARLGKKPASRLTKSEQGRMPSEGELRKGGARQQPYPGQAVTDVTGGDEIAAARILDRADDRCDDPAALCLHQEEIERLTKAIAALPKNIMREILKRHFFGGETFKEISATLGISEYLVRRRLAQALEQLKQSPNLTSMEDRS